VVAPVVEIRVPVENVNDDWAVLVALHAANGAAVRRNDPIATVETTKAAVELAAPAAGLFHGLAQAGERVPVGAVLGVIAPDAGAIEAYLAARAGPAVPADGTAPHAWPEGVTFSRKARELIVAHGLAPARFARLRLVREADVLAALEGPGSAAPGEAPHPALHGIDLTNVGLAAGLGDPRRGPLDPGFLARLLADPSGFAARPEREKLALYREHGAEVGEDVRLGEGSFVAAPWLVLADGAEIGAGSDIRCRERFVLGPLGRIGDRCQTRCLVAAFGANVHAGKGIEIGGGGNRDPWAVLSVGDLAYLGDGLFLNTCKPILIGREAFVTQRSILVTHNIGHSVLEGFENRFAPVVLEDGAQVGMGCTVYAGVRIGRYAVLGSNSYAVTSIPAEAMALGVPARVTGSARRALDPARQASLARAMLVELGELLRLKGVPVTAVDGSPALEVRAGEGETRTVEFHEVLPPTLPEAGAAAAERVVLVLHGARRVPGAVAVVDLLGRHVHGEGGVLLETVREFLRKRGIRCTPLPWRYRDGLI
jgi:acetyltransferase-like isoleucine patch superfamily enzyme